MTTEATQLAQNLRNQVAAVRLKVYRFGVNKALSQTQITQAAESFHAEPQVITAKKKILNTRNEAYSRVTNIQHQAKQYWRQWSVPYPEPGIRLIRRDLIDQFVQKMNELQEQLAAAVGTLQDQCYTDMREAARQRLGDLWNSADYPDSLQHEFSISWEFPSIDPPQYLKALSPALYEQEQQRISAKLEESLHLAEQAFAGELAEMVETLHGRLTGEKDGKPKTLRKDALAGISEFLDRIKTVNITGSESLDLLVSQTREALSGVSADALNTNVIDRGALAQRLQEITGSLDKVIIDRPKRAISLADEEPEQTTAEAA